MNLNATLFAQVVVFLMLAWFTMKFIWPPLIQALDERASRIAEGLSAAEKSKAELEAVRKHIHESLAQTRDQSQKCIAEAEKQALVIADELKANAQAQATRIIAAAKIDADQQMAQAREMLHAEVAALAIKVAEQILKKEIDIKAHTNLLGQIQSEL